MTTLSQRLRQKLLDLAIRGKLVPQDAHDEPASELLERIRNDELGMRNGRARRAATAEPISDDEKPFDLPKGWCWCRLGEIAYVATGKTPSKTDFVDDGVPYLKMYNLRKQKIDFAFKRQYVKREVHEGQLARSRLAPGDLLMNIVGPPLGKLAIIPESLPEANFNQAAVMIRSYREIATVNRYLFYYLSQMDEINSIDTKGTAGQDNISLTQAQRMRIALPPLAEQKRIVAALDGMLAAADAVAAGTDKIAALKEKARAKILDLAIRGKLVKQDKRDGSADELVKQMREADICEVRPRKHGEKVPPERCIVGLPDHKLVSVRPKDSVEPVAEDEQYFEIPESWRWVRLRELGVFSGGHTPSLADPKFWDGGDILWVTSKDMKRKYITDTGKKVTKAGAEELGVLPVGTMLMVVRSGILRRTFPIAIAKEPLTINQDQRALQFYVPEVGEYVYAVLKGLEHIVLRDYRKTGTTVESIIWEKFINMPIPLPPLAEQKRIVAKVDEMLAACDGLVGEV